MSHLLRHNDELTNAVTKHAGTIVIYVNYEFSFYEVGWEVFTKRKVFLNDNVCVCVYTYGLPWWHTFNAGDARDVGSIPGS